MKSQDSMSPEQTNPIITENDILLAPDDSQTSSNQTQINAKIDMVYKIEQSKQALGSFSPFIQPGATAESISKMTINSEIAYGSVPGMKDLDNHLLALQDDIEYFKKSGIILGTREINSILLYRLKFNHSITKLTEAILAHYPIIGKQGKSISLFGLSGSGKSLAMDAISEFYGEKIIVIDSDKTRINLFAKLVKDLETANGNVVNGVSSTLLHVPISGPLYTAIAYVVQILKNRGYIVIQASLGVNRNTDEIYYLEHRDVDIQNLEIPEDPEQEQSPEFVQAVTKLSAITTIRFLEKDGFDWENPKQETDFRKMHNIIVDVSPKTHAHFIKEVKKLLETLPNIKIIQNPKTNNPAEAKKNIINQLQFS